MPSINGVLKSFFRFHHPSRLVRFTLNKGHIINAAGRTRQAQRQVYFESIATDLCVPFLPAQALPSYGRPNNDVALFPRPQVDSFSVSDWISPPLFVGVKVGRMGGGGGMVEGW